MIGWITHRDTQKKEAENDRKVEAHALGALERFEKALGDLEKLLKSENKEEDDLRVADRSYGQSRSSS